MIDDDDIDDDNDDDDGHDNHNYARYSHEVETLLLRKEKFVVDIQAERCT